MPLLDKNTKFEKTFTLTYQNNNVYQLETHGTFLDRDIELTFNVQDAQGSTGSITTDARISSASGNNGGTNISSVVSSKSSTEPSSGYYIAVIPEASCTPTVTRPGWVESNSFSTATSIDSPKYFSIKEGLVYTSSELINWSHYFTEGTASDYNINYTVRVSSNEGYIPNQSLVPEITHYYKLITTQQTAGEGHLTLTPENGRVSIRTLSGDSSNSNNPSIHCYDGGNSNKPYYTIIAEGSGSVSGVGSGTVNVGTGWITAGNTTSGTRAYSISSNTATYQKYINKSINDTPVINTLPSTLYRDNIPFPYEDIEIQPGGYVKIPEGYSPYDRYVYANKANISTEAEPASNYTLTINNVGNNGTFTIGQDRRVNNNKDQYSVKISSLDLTGTFAATNPGWFISGQAQTTINSNDIIGWVNQAILSSTSTKLEPYVIPSFSSMDFTSNMLLSEDQLAGKIRQQDYWKITAGCGTTGQGHINTNTIVTQDGWVKTTDAYHQVFWTIDTDVRPGESIYIPRAQYSTENNSITVTSGGWLPKDAVIAQNIGSMMAEISPTFVDGVLKNKTATITPTNITLSETNHSGIELQSIGSAGRRPVYYENPYDGHISIPVNTIASPAIEASSWNGTKYYVDGATIQPPESGTRYFDITVPNNSLNEYITFRYTVDAQGHYTVEELSNPLFRTSSQDRFILSNGDTFKVLDNIEE